MRSERGKKRRGAAPTTTPEQNQQKQFYQKPYSLASLKMGSILLHLQGAAERDQNAWDIFANCLSHYVALKYGGPNR